MVVGFDNEKASSLLRLVAAGDQIAYRELFNMISPRAYAFARRMISQHHLAGEVLVDAMHEVWRTAGQFRGDSKVCTWVLGIVRNKALMAIRSAGSVQHEDIDEFSEVIDSGMPDGFDLLEQKQSREIIHRCLERLSEKHRECIHLTHFEDCSMAEIAKLLQVPEGTVKSRLSHARVQLAACVSAVLNRTTAHAVSGTNQQVTK